MTTTIQHEAEECGLAAYLESLEEKVKAQDALSREKESLELRVIQLE